MNINGSLPPEVGYVPVVLGNSELDAPDRLIEQ
jgi:hypothetical protein